MDIHNTWKQKRQ